MDIIILMVLSYCFVICTGEIQLVKKDVLATYIIADNAIYYEYQDANENWNCKRFDLMTLEEKLLLGGYDGYIFADKQYVYEFSNNSQLVVYNHEGNLVCIVTPEIEDCYFGDDTYLIGKSNGLTYILEVSDLADGQAEWTCLE